MTISIFISYSRRDKAAADYIADELRSRGADVFLDYERLMGGENFIGRLGREIEERDCLILLVSPRSVASRWVQAEIAWALNCNKMIIPVVLEQASLVDLFFLVNVEHIDFTAWYDEENTDVKGPVTRLARALGLPPHTEVEVPVVRPLPEADALETEIFDPDASQVDIQFDRESLADMFLSAAEIAGEEPERAIFLYRKVLEIDPDYGRGEARQFIEREQKRLKPLRLENMHYRARQALASSDWRQAEQIGRDMLVLDPDNRDAQDVILKAKANARCEPIYTHALLAAERGRWGAVATLLNDVRDTCPDYGDPAGLLRIRREAIDWTRQLAVLDLQPGTVNDLAFSPDGALLASGGGDTVIQLWSRRRERVIRELRGHTGGVNTLAFSLDGALLASGSDDMTVRVWDVTTGDCLMTFKEGHSQAVNVVAFSPDGARLITGGGDRRVRFWDLASGEAVHTLSDFESWVLALVALDDGRVITGSGDRQVMQWQMADYAGVALYAHDSPVTRLALSPEARFLASASMDGGIAVWDVGRGVERVRLASHTGTVHALAFSPDGALLVSGGDDHRIRLWDVASETLLLTLTGHEAEVHALAFSPDGALLASGAADKSVRLWGFG